MLEKLENLILIRNALVDAHLLHLRHENLSREIINYSWGIKAIFHVPEAFA